MPGVGIITDSTCDLGPSALADLGVRMIPLIVRFDDGEYRDWLDLRPREFYAKLAASTNLPKTSQPSPAQFATAYEEMAADGLAEIVVITLSAALSGTYQSATVAAQDAPVPVHVVDGRSASLGTALIVRAAVEARDEGLDAVSIRDRALDVAQASQLLFLLDTMDCLVRGGRAGKAAGLAASVLCIKPVLEVNADGVIEPFAKVRGRRQAIGRLATHVAEESQAKGRLRLALLHAADETELEEVEGALAAARADIEIVERGEIGAVIGTYTGLGAVGVAYHPAR